VARLSMPRQTSVSTAASVVTTPSMVAMLGWIMPLPLHMPPTLTGTPPMVTRRAASFDTRSGGGGGQDVREHAGACVHVCVSVRSWPCKKELKNT
jgi:hypothetical protein